VLGPRMPELSALEVLVTVAGSGSLNAAAARLGVSQQAVSARISAIEALVGVTLVRRTSRGSSLTPAGAAVSEAACAKDAACGANQASCGYAPAIVSLAASP